MDQYRELLKMNREAGQHIDEASRLFIAGLMEMQPEKVFYPDANFTMRLSYGSVGDYEHVMPLYTSTTPLWKASWKKKMPRTSNSTFPKNSKSCTPRETTDHMPMPTADCMSISPPTMTSPVATRAVPSSTAKAN